MAPATAPRPADPSAHALAARVLDRCDRLARHTDEPGRITRLYLSDATRAAHAELRGWMIDAGLTVRTDNAGNLIGRRPAADDVPDGTPAPRVLLLGSHLDTVPDAGRYDGVLGVMIALAAVEALAAEPLAMHIDVVGFSEEEGVRFDRPYLGSAAAAGTFDPGWLRRNDASGASLQWAIERFGLDPTAIAQDAYDPAEVLGYTEVHLEQGPVLASAGRPVGVVTAIQGQSRLRVRFVGKPAHAGTTPMDARQDALAAAAHWMVRVQSVGRATGDLRATVGQVEVGPGARNVVPGIAELSLDVRHDLDDVRRSATDGLLHEAGQIAEDQGVRFEVLDAQDQPATPMDPALSQALEGAMQDADLEPARLPSGAGHDAVAMAALGPVAMLFVRDPGAASHHPDERVEVEDVAAAVGTLTAYIRRLAAAIDGSPHDAAGKVSR